MAVHRTLCSLVCSAILWGTLGCGEYEPQKQPAAPSPAAAGQATPGASPQATPATTAPSLVGPGASPAAAPAASAAPSGVTLLPTSSGAAPASGAAAPAVSGAGSALRYRWQPGQRYAYDIAIASDFQDKWMKFQARAVYSLASPVDAAGAAAGQSKELATGTAFAVAPGGYLATCAHVVRGAGRIQVTLGGKKYEGEVLAVDNPNDLALLRIPDPDAVPLPVGSSDKVQLAEEVSVIGYPLSSTLGVSVKVTRGSVAGVADTEGNRLFQIDASVNPGNSGGPAVNSRGEAIGVVNSKLTGEDVSNVGFAVPIEHLRRLLESRGVRPQTGGADKDLAGPELARRVTPSVALVTIYSGPGKAWGPGFVALRVQGRGVFQSGQVARPGQPPARPSEIRPKDLNARLVVDEFGAVVDADNDVNLPCLLGPLGQLILDPLSPTGERAWQTVAPTVLAVPIGQQNQGSSPMDRFGGLARPRGMPGVPHGRLPGPIGPRGPGSAGPIGPRGPSMRGPRGLGPRGAAPGPSAPPPSSQPDSTPSVILCPATETVAYELRPAAEDNTVIARRYSFQTSEKGNVPVRLNVSNVGEILFSTKIGLPEKFESKGSFRVTANSEEIHIPFSVTYQRVDPDGPLPEALAALSSGSAAGVGIAPFARGSAVRPPPGAAAPPAKLAEASPADLDALLKEVESAENSVRRCLALAKLSQVKADESRRRDVAKLLHAYLSDADRQTQRAALRAMGVWAHKGNLPRLLPLLDNQDPGIRMPLFAALARTEDPRAAEAMAPLLANLGDRGRVAGALRSMGSVAEDAVLALLEHHDAFTRAEACNILGEIGGPKSVAALKNLAGRDAQFFAKSAAQRALRELEKKKAR